MDTEDMKAVLSAVIQSLPKPIAPINDEPPLDPRRDEVYRFGVRALGIFIEEAEKARVREWIDRKAKKSTAGLINEHFDIEQGPFVTYHVAVSRDELETVCRRLAICEAQLDDRDYKAWMSAHIKQRTKEIRRREIRSGRRGSRCKSSKGAQLRAKYRQYMDGALSRGYVWDLTEKEFANLTDAPCVYCGSSESGAERGMGLDRWDNYIGYKVNNVVPCCKDCNRAKNTQAPRDYVESCRRIAANHGATVPEKLEPVINPLGFVMDWKAGIDLEECFQ